MKEILIIEDNVSDLKWYSQLFSGDKKISLILYNRNKNYSKEQILELLDLLYEDLFKGLNKYFICNQKNEVGEILKNNFFDFYIFDSLGKEAGQIILDSGLAKEKVAVLSSTTSFRRFIKEKGYHAYRKADINELIKECIDNDI